MRHRMAITKNKLQKYRNKLKQESNATTCILQLYKESASYIARHQSNCTSITPSSPHPHPLFASSGRLLPRSSRDDVRLRVLPQPRTRVTPPGGREGRRAGVEGLEGAPVRPRPHALLVTDLDPGTVSARG